MLSDKAQRQLDSKILESRDSGYGVCVDKESDWKDWLLQKHPDGDWVTVRKALPAEIAAAHAQYNLLRALAYHNSASPADSEGGNS